MDNKKSIFILIGVAIFLIIVMFAMLFFLRPGGGLFDTFTADTESLNENYSNINQIAPGVDTWVDVENVMGEPIETSISEGKTVLYYKTPLEDDNNMVVLKNDVVEYAIEKVYGNYRGTYDSYINRYGEPDIIMIRDPGEREFWAVYLDEGIIITTSGNKISTMTYFVPQDEGSFSEGVAKDLGLVVQEEAVGGEVFYGPDGPPENELPFESTTPELE